MLSRCIPSSSYSFPLGIYLQLYSCTAVQLYSGTGTVVLSGPAHICVVGDRRPLAEEVLVVIQSCLDDDQHPVYPVPYTHLKPPTKADA